MAYKLLGTEGYSDEQDTRYPLFKTCHAEWVEIHSFIVCNLPMFK